MKMNVKRLKRTSSFFSAISLLIAAVLVIAVIATVALGITLLVNDELMSKAVEEMAPQTFVKDDVYVIMAVVGIVVPLIAVMFFLAYMLFRNINESETPFSTENVKILKWVSYLLLILAVPVSIIIGILVIHYSSWDVDAATWVGGLPLVFVAVLFYFMAHVFEYGAELQKESDETL